MSLSPRKMSLSPRKMSLDLELGLLSYRLKAQDIERGVAAFRLSGFPRKMSLSGCGVKCSFSRLERESGSMVAPAPSLSLWVDRQ